MKFIVTIFLTCFSVISFTQTNGKTTSGVYAQLCTGEGNFPTSPVWNYAPYKIFVPCPQVKVGIGTNNPQENLDVNGGGQFLYVKSAFYVNTGTLTAQRVKASHSVVIKSNINEAFVVKQQNNNPVFIINGGGSVGIHNRSNQHPFTVKANNGVKILQLENSGLLRARRIRVDTDNWADYVFVNGYKLLSLQEISRFIKANGHLPNIPSAKTLKKYGVDINDMLRLQMEKIEELTLYTIQQDNQLKQLNQKVDKLEQELEEIRKMIKNR